MERKESELLSDLSAQLIPYSNIRPGLLSFLSHTFTFPRQNRLCLQVLRLPVDVRVHQSPDIAGHRDANIGRTGDNNSFVGSGKAQRTLPVAVAVCLIPLPVRLFTSNTECHKRTSPQNNENCIHVYIYCTVFCVICQEGKRHRQRRASGNRGAQMWVK